VVSLESRESRDFDQGIILANMRVIMVFWGVCRVFLGFVWNLCDSLGIPALGIQWILCGLHILANMTAFVVFWGVYRVYFSDLWNFVEFVDFVMSRRYRGSWDSLGSAYLGEYDGIYGVLGCLQGVFCGFVEVCGISGITEWSACSRICYRCSYWVDLGICLRTALPSPSPAPPPHSQIT